MSLILKDLYNNCRISRPFGLPSSMWNKRNSQYAAADDDEIPLTQLRRTRWKTFKSWVQERPATSALITLVIIGSIVAVIVGPIISSQHEQKDNDDEPSGRALRFSLTFQAKNGSQLCENFADLHYLASYGTKLQVSISSILGIQQSQVAIQSVQCDSKMYNLPAGSASGNRRFSRMLSFDVGSGISIVVTFLVLPPGAESTTQAGFSPDVVHKPEVAASQLQSSSVVLLGAMSQALGLPASNLVFISVVTSGNAVSTAPVLSTETSLPPSQPSVRSAPSSILATAYQPPMATSSRASPAPVYTSGLPTQSSLPIPSQPPTYGTYGDGDPH
ncbi:hypothetical protein Vafri_14878 [Volvox africanus]|uniref:Uncharacterized protein n=1 Tax=Volvox africanus TaxID=51714 RepID=A0A8J4F817_9CHLO|nr:hypothetical protein Vafri_14878 [Volvox africanus]